MAGNARRSVTGSLADPDLGAAFGLGHLIMSRRAFQNSKRPLPRLTQGIRVSHDALCCGKAEVGAWALVATARRGEGKATVASPWVGTCTHPQTTGRPLGSFPDRTSRTCFGRKGHFVLGCDGGKVLRCPCAAGTARAGGTSGSPTCPIPTGTKAQGSDLTGGPGEGVVQVTTGFGDPKRTAGSVALAPT